MSWHILRATIVRVVRQLLHDHRTIALLIVVPIVLLLFVHALFGEAPGAFDRIGLAMLGIFSAPRFIGWFDQRIRVAVLAICAIAAVVAMAKIVISG